MATMLFMLLMTTVDGMDDVWWMLLMDDHDGCWKMMDDHDGCCWWWMIMMNATADNDGWCLWWASDYFAYTLFCLPKFAYAFFVSPTEDHPSIIMHLADSSKRSFIKIFIQNTNILSSGRLLVKYLGDTYTYDRCCCCWWWRWQLWWWG